MVRHGRALLRDADEYDRLATRADQVLRHLALAERHVEQGAARLARQQVLVLVSELARDGHDTTEAEKLLANLEGLQVMHRADRDSKLTTLQQSGMPNWTG